MAAKAPKTIEAIEMKTMTCCQSTATGVNPSTAKRTMSAMAATFGAPASSAVIGVGAPS